MNSHTHNTHHHKHAHKKMAHMHLTVVLHYLSQQSVCLVMIQNKKRLQSKKNS